MEKAIEAFIMENFMGGAGSLTKAQSLIEEEIIDSMDLLKLIGFIEDTYGVSVEMGEITVDNFDSIQNIVELIKEKVK